MILDRFNSAGDTKKQDILLASGIKAYEIKRRRQMKENYTSMVPVKKAKLDDVKSLMKYISQPTIDYINSIPELLAVGEDDDEEQDD